MLMLISEFSKDAPVMTIYLQSLTGRWKWERWITNTDCMSLDKTWANLLVSVFVKPNQNLEVFTDFHVSRASCYFLVWSPTEYHLEVLSSQPKPNPQLDTFLSGDRFWAGLLGGGKELKWKTTVSNPNSGGGVPWAVLPALSPPWAGRPQVFYHPSIILLLSFYHWPMWVSEKLLKR